MKHRKILFALILTFIAGWSFAVFALQSFNTNEVNAKVEPPVIRLADDPINKMQLTKTVNDWKVSQGKAPYIESEFLCDIAETRVVEVQTTWSHDGFSAKRFCTGECWLGENLSRYSQTATQTLKGWLNSPSHREVLEEDYTHACIATDGSYAVQIFGYY